MPDPKLEAKEISDNPLDDPRGNRGEPPKRPQSRPYDPKPKKKQRLVVAAALAIIAVIAVITSL